MKLNFSHSFIPISDCVPPVSGTTLGLGDSEVSKAGRAPALSQLPLPGRNTDSKPATKLQGISAHVKGREENKTEGDAMMVPLEGLL